VVAISNAGISARLVQYAGPFLPDRPFKRHDAERPQIPAVSEDFDNWVWPSAPRGDAPFPPPPAQPAPAQRKWVDYALARGLCGLPAAHHQPQPGNLEYNKPRARFPKIPDLRLKVRKERSGPARRASLAAFCGATLDPARDFSDTRPGSADAATDRALRLGSRATNPSRGAKWAPVHARTEGSKTWLLPDHSNASEDVSEAAVLEQAVGHFRRLAGEARDPYRRRLALCAAAAAKVKQLRPMAASIAREASLRCPPVVRDPALPRIFSFRTNPVLNCRDRVLYPLNAGLDAVENSVEEPDGAGKGEVEKQLFDNRVLATQTLRGWLGDGAEPPPVFVAPPSNSVERRGSELVDVLNALGDSPPSFPQLDVGIPSLPRDEEQVARVDVENLRRVVEGAALAMEEEEAAEREILRIEEMIEEKRQGGGAGASDLRREAVLTDAVREAELSDDRLYSFVRQLSGTIGESVSDVCQVDDSALVRHQREDGRRRLKQAEEASKQHMALVSSVVGAMIRESGLALGIGRTSELKVVSSTLRKQVDDIVKRGGEGQFATSVRLENLLAQGSGEMTLDDLFQRLNEAGVAMQNAALRDVGPEAESASLDVLSAPRNSLILRYKPETLAAVKKAYYTFTAEFRAKTYGMREISAFELVEGASDELSAAFATFSAHVLAQSRLFSTQNAIYVSASSARSNATMLRITLAKLVEAAQRYVHSYPAPSFSEDGRARYFRK
jgi:hypothetical protein